MVRKGILVLYFLLLTACVTSQPDNVNQRYAQAQNNLRKLFAEHREITRKINFYQALARGVKYNLDYRLKLANTALQCGQLELAEFTMLPTLNVSGSLYTRNNDLATTGITSTGQVTDVLTATPRTLRSVRIPLSWNILDFGMSYVKAKQQSERVLIAEEESRKQLQLLAQDILVTYWNAYSIQELINCTRVFQIELTKAKERLASAILDKTIPKENVLQYEAAILDGNRQLIKLQNKYAKAILDLKVLLNLPLDCNYILEAPPSLFIKTANLDKIDFCKLDAIALVKRPELTGQNYQIRIAREGIAATILQALPGVILNDGANYNSNQFLINNKWLDKSVDVAWNLLNLASLPSSIKNAQTQIKYEQLKSMALTLTVLTEVRLAYFNSHNLAEEYRITKKQVENANALYVLAYQRKRASLGSNQQVILAKMRWITAKMDENLLLADLSTAIGQLYLSAGFDILPINANYLSLSQIERVIKMQAECQAKLDFTQYVDLTYQRLFHDKKYV